MTEQALTETFLLAPPPYQQQVADYLERNEPELWRWATSVAAQSQYADQVRVELLKETYRLDADAHPQLAAACAAAAAPLGVNDPVTLYQGRGTAMNASVFSLPGEVHVVLLGPVLSVLRPLELQALLAHELAHHHLWQIDGGRLRHARRLLDAVAVDARAAPGHLQTLRRFRLYGEIYADRGALLGCGDLEAAVAALVKTETGLTEVSAEAYLRQAEEVFARSDAASAGVSHPELFTRARALRLWSERDQGLDAWLAATIEGGLVLDELDLLGQQRVQELTRRLLAALLRPRWFRTESTLAHARRYFPDFVPAVAEDPGLAAGFATADAAARRFLCSLLLDFATADRELEDLPLAQMLEWSRQLGVEKEFDALAARELGLGKRALQKARREAAALLAKAEATGG